MPFKAIVEIGPISNYLYSTRKARDLWGGSFLFSYLMGVVAKSILHNESHSEIAEIIKRPAIEKDQLYNVIQNGTFDFSQVEAGTIPDRLYCVLNNDKTLLTIKNTFPEEILELFKKSKNDIRHHFQDKFQDFDQENKTAKVQLNQFFRLFYVHSDKMEFDDLEESALTRSRILEYDQTFDKTNTVKDKFERCQLCGDRKSVIILNDVRPGKNNGRESLCAICTLKRGLISVIKGKEQAGFPSTTKISATVTYQVLKQNFSTIKGILIEFFNKQRTEGDLRKNCIDEWGIGQYKAFSDKCVKNSFNNATFKDMEPYLEFRNYFSDHDEACKLRERLRKIYDDQIKKNKEKKNRLVELKQSRAWLDRPFFTMVYLDGDGMGSILRELARKNEYDLMGNISKNLSEFANNVSSIINKFDGQLIYAGGEDVLLMVHPVYLMKLVIEIAEDYKNRVSDIYTEKLNNIFTDSVKLTLSGGAYICHHKHPLKLAIEGAHRMEQKAKSQPSKNTLAIQLHKGSGERAEVILPIISGPNNNGFNLQNFQEIINKIHQDELYIPRGFVYKLSEEYEVMQSIIKGKQDLLNYVSFLLEKSRDSKESKLDYLNELIQYSFKCNNNQVNYKSLIDRLYFLRFLTEGE